MRKTNFLKLLIFIIVFATIAEALIILEAFEWVYEFSRSHEDWEMDEWILVALAALITGVLWFGVESRRLSAQVRAGLEAEHDRERKYDAIRRVQTLGTLAGGVAHSGNNLLQPILTMARLGRRQADDPEHVKLALSRIEEASEHLAELFASILRFSRGNTIEGGQSDVTDLFERSRPLFDIGLSENIRISERYNRDHAVVPVSENDLVDVMLALIGNANDSYGDKGGEILITVEGADNDPNRLKIGVRDFGAGVPLDVVERVFEPFYTTKDVGKGTGLGLSIVRNIVERAGGWVDLNSAPGAGTTVIVELPLVKVAEQ